MLDTNLVSAGLPNNRFFNNDLKPVKEFLHGMCIEKDFMDAINKIKNNTPINDPILFIHFVLYIYPAKRLEKLNLPEIKLDNTQLSDNQSELKLHTSIISLI